jgi:hypothetical protein
MPMKLRPGLLFLIALGLGTQSGRAQEDPIVERMRKDVTFLASDECEGRGVGTKGLDKAADYIADQFAKGGLKPAGVNGTWFQPFPFTSNSQLDGVSTLVLTGPKDQKITLKQGTDFQVLGFSGSGKITTPLVFVGYGATALGIPYNDYAGVDVAGKTVVALRRLPRWNSKEAFDGGNKDKLASLENKQQSAHANKAAALILVNDASELPKDDLIPFQTTSRSGSTIALPYVQIKRSVFDEILRASTGKSIEETEKAIDDDLKPLSAVLQGWSAELEVKVKRQQTIVKNVVGVLEGKGPLANETVIVGGHYDHLGYGGRGSLAKDKNKKDIHHGADDNASGSTAVMELARRFGAMKDRVGRRLVFMTFTAEESGLIGSRHYCQVSPLFPLKDTSAMFNLDMVGRLRENPKGGKDKLLVEGVDTAKEFDALVTKLNPGFEVIKEKSVFGASDHYSFYTQKIPVLFFWTGTHPDYHKPTDTADKINVPGMKRVTDYAERVIDHLATEPKRPEYVFVPTKARAGGAFPKLGILPDYTFDGKGVMIEGISQGGAAEQAGIQKGDVIFEIAGKAVPNVDGYMAVLKQQRPGATIDIKILRDSKEMQLKVTPK